MLRFAQIKLEGNIRILVYGVIASLHASGAMACSTMNIPDGGSIVKQISRLANGHYEVDAVEKNTTNEDLNVVKCGNSLAEDISIYSDFLGVVEKNRASAEILPERIPKNTSVRFKIELTEVLVKPWKA